MSRSSDVGVSRQLPKWQSFRYSSDRGSTISLCTPLRMREFDERSLMRRLWLIMLVGLVPAFLTGCGGDDGSTTTTQASNTGDSQPSSGGDPAQYNDNQYNSEDPAQYNDNQYNSEDPAQYNDNQYNSEDPAQYNDNSDQSSEDLAKYNDSSSNVPGDGNKSSDTGSSGGEHGNSGGGSDYDSARDNPRRGGSSGESGKSSAGGGEHGNSGSSSDSGSDYDSSRDHPRGGGSDDNSGGGEHGNSNGGGGSNDSPSRPRGSNDRGGSGEHGAGDNARPPRGRDDRGGSGEHGSNDNADRPRGGGNNGGGGEHGNSNGGGGGNDGGMYDVPADRRPSDDYGSEDYNSPDYNSSGGSGGSGRNEKRPATYAGFAQEAFRKGMDSEALNYLYADILTNDAAAASQRLRFLNAENIKKPTMAVRWGIGVQYSAPRNFTKKPPMIGAKPHETEKRDSNDRNGGNRGVKRSSRVFGSKNRENNNDEYSSSSDDYNNDGPAAKAPKDPKEMLFYYTGDVGDRFVERVQMRREREFYGPLLKSAPGTWVAQERDFKDNNNGGDDYGSGYSGDDPYGKRKSQSPKQLTSVDPRRNNDWRRCDQENC